MANKNKPSQEPGEPELLKDVMSGFLDDLEAGTLQTPRSDKASLRYEEENNAVLRHAAKDPAATDEQIADLAEILHEGDVAIQALKEGRGHGPSPDDVV